MDPINEPKARAVGARLPALEPGDNRLEPGGNNLAPMTPLASLDNTVQPTDGKMASNGTNLPPLSTHASTGASLPTLPSLDTFDSKPDLPGEGLGALLSDVEGYVEGAGWRPSSLEELSTPAWAESLSDSHAEFSLPVSSEVPLVETDENGYTLDFIITKAIEMDASDIYLKPNETIAFTINGLTRRIDELGYIDHHFTEAIFYSVATSVLEQEFVEEWELDTSYVVETGPYRGRRTRLNVGKTGSYHFMVFRIIADEVVSMDALGLEPEIQDLLNYKDGLVMFNGPTGSGKTTSLGSMIGHVLRTTPKVIITIEKPIEIDHDSYKNEHKGLIIQREVGRDCRSFAGGLKSALRENPDMILIGEVRDREEINEFLRAAETGHLAFATMHATSAPAALTRISSQFPDEGSKGLVLSTMATSSRGFINQSLVRKPEGGRFAVRETLIFNDQVRQFFSEGDALSLQRYMIDKELTMDQKLARVVADGITTPEEAFAQSSDPILFRHYLSDLGIKHSL